MTNSKIFLDYVQACSARDLERALSFYVPDATYHNIPMPLDRGIEAIRRVLGDFFNSASETSFEIHSIAESPSGTVLTERTDNFRINGVLLSVKVMGAVEFANGKITAWREYYDSRQMEAEFAKAAPS